MIRLPRFSAFNLALGYILLSVVMLAVFAAPLWYAWQENVGKHRIEFLRDDARRLASIFQQQGAAGLASVIDARLQRHHPRENVILLADPSLHRLAGNLPEWPAKVPASPTPFVLPVMVDGNEVRAVLTHTELPGGYQLLVGGDTTRFQALEHFFWYGLAGAVTLILLFGVGGGLMIRRALISEVARINQTASAIVAGDLSRRLPARDGADELDLLALTVNRMLDQIENLIHGVKNVSNSIAHDLRTPLAELRSRLEELSVTRPSPEETFAELESAVADVDRVIGIFNAILRLAEIDTGARRSGFVTVELEKVAAGAAEFYQPVAEQREIALSCISETGLRVAGDSFLLAQGIANLIDNALKYSPARGAIAVEASRHDDGHLEVSVSDGGPGIPDHEKPKVTERFYRGDASRGTTSGMGLGLTLVAAVARLHGGTLELADNHPGLRATLLFPATARTS
jgi:signal transduction histidine kinase